MYIIIYVCILMIVYLCLVYIHLFGNLHVRLHCYMWYYLQIMCIHIYPATWFLVVDFLVKLCSHDSFKHILRLFWVGKKSATFCLSARKSVVLARFRVTKK